ncbi:histidine kinase [Solwaraspora sp. WMMD406]|uniref:sensor histidine kinase n=1 Tax=Solwaraspora sp. WMMD406 TaxID=3016095 RepID=UPI002417FFC3|nr:histidine kinase [Solwaraspora sp. WMMD406]MDG4764027.1 histidine kinase [Solwaraspora sp. WMMD406]
MSAVPAPDNPWLLPATLIADAAGTGRRRRSTRDWLVDAICLLIAVGYLVWAAWDMRQPQPYVTATSVEPGWFYRLDLMLGLASCGLLWVRRRWPAGVALIALPIGVLSVTGGIAVLILLFTVAVHRPLAVAAGVAVAHLTVSPIFYLIYPDRDLDLFGAVVLTAIVIGAVLAWGMFVRARRQLVVSLRDRAYRAEAEQLLRVAQARQLERTRIAREMHDVLAHRISLLSLHAGALEFRPDASREEITRAAGVIRVTAHQALEELREVIGVLRSDHSTAPAGPTGLPGPTGWNGPTRSTGLTGSTGQAGNTALVGGPEPPQPTLADLPELVAESRNAGTRVTLTSEIDQPSRLPTGLGRAAYRIVQEGLTNVRKHAPGAAAKVAVRGRPGAGLTVEVTNRRSVSRPPDSPIPGSGTGLVGLAERASLVGGRLDYGTTESGYYRLVAWLPWPP